MVISSKRAATNLSKDIIMAIYRAGKLSLDLILKDEKKREVRDALRRLKKLKILGIAETDGISKLYLKERGIRKAISYSLDELIIERPKKWDGKWRVIVFDIPEKKRVARNVFKNKLDKLGFTELQKSVYIHPFECRDVIEFLIGVYELNPFVNFLIAESINSNKKIEKRYKL